MNGTELSINKQADEAVHFKGFQQNKRNNSWRLKAKIHGKNMCPQDTLLLSSGR
jgi:hypothetical protein